MTEFELLASFLIKSLLGVAIGVLLAMPILLYQARRLFRLARSGMSEIDRMSWKEFEEYLELMFLRLGYQVQRTPAQRDWGADLILTLHGIKTAVQAKHRTAGRVGVSAVREVVAAKEKYECSGAMVISNDSYTPEALALAKPNRVVMIDRNRLAEMLVASRTRPPLRRDVPRASEPTAVRATCHTCGVPVSNRVRDYCISNRDRFNGRILCMHHQRTA